MADITTRQALDALKEELKTQRERDPYWRFKQGHKFKTAWAEMWPGGSWISLRVGDSEQAKNMRASMSEAELKELDELKEVLRHGHHDSSGFGCAERRVENATGAGPVLALQVRSQVQDGVGGDVARRYVDLSTCR